jgi:hypothetical protein
MAKATECLIPVEFALKLRDLDKNLARWFRCAECGEAVEPHEAGTDPSGVAHAAHFEHVTGNPECRKGHYYKTSVP